VSLWRPRRGAHWSFASERTGAQRLGLSSSKRSGGQGDPYPKVLDGGSGSLAARSGGALPSIFGHIVGFFQGVNDASTQRRAAAAPHEAHRMVQSLRRSVENHVTQCDRVLVLVVGNWG
jgi:hypothetical protein